MADYIYLLQNRLNPAQRRALEAVREAAKARGATVFLVGGAVRDLSSGAPVRDLDFAVQGDASAVVEELLGGGAAEAGRREALGATYLTFAGGVRVEVGPTLTVTYPKPGQPETQPATILDDLRRRDFTANAMAISLNEGSFGLLMDPLNGIADIENRELRLVSNYGFVEQPALLLRIARLSDRLGWTLEERTAGRYQTAKEEGYIDALPQSDRGYELEEIFHEDDPLSTLEHMEAEGWRDVLVPALLASKTDRTGLDAVRDLVGQMEALGIYPDPSIVFFPMLTAKLPPSDLLALKGLFARPGFVQQIETAEARAKELAGQLTSKAAATPSETWKLLFAAEPEVVLWLAQHSRSSAVQGKLKAFLKEWPQMRQRIPHAVMQEMRITPDLPGYERLLEDLFFALLDGKLDTPEATRAFLEPYSPPAPPVQVNVRRRPAKATRGRSKKAVAALAAVTNEEDEDDESSAEDVPAKNQAPPAEVEPDSSVSSLPEKTAAVPSAPRAAAKAPAKQEPKATAAETVEPAKAPKEGTTAGRNLKAEVEAGGKDPAKTTPAKVASSKNSTPAVPAKKAVPPPSPAKKTVTPPVRPAAAKQAQAQATATPSKIAAKTAAKVAAKVGAKMAGKAVKGAKGAGKAAQAKAPAPASKSAARKTPGATKTVPAKTKAAKATPKKAAAKQPVKTQVAKRPQVRGQAAAKQGATKTTAKKAASKAKPKRR